MTLRIPAATLMDWRGEAHHAEDPHIEARIRMLIDEVERRYDTEEQLLRRLAVLQNKVGEEVDEAAQALLVKLDQLDAWEKHLDGRQQKINARDAALPEVVRMFRATYLERKHDVQLLMRPGWVGAGAEQLNELRDWLLAAIEWVGTASLIPDGAVGYAGWVSAQTSLPPLGVDVVVRNGLGDQRYRARLHRMASNEHLEWRGPTNWPLHVTHWMYFTPTQQP